MTTAMAVHDIGGSERAFAFREVAEQKQGGSALVTGDNDVPGANFGLDSHEGTLSVGYWELAHEENI